MEPGTSSQNGETKTGNGKVFNIARWPTQLFQHCQHYLGYTNKPKPIDNHPEITPTPNVENNAITVGLVVADPVKAHPVAAPLKAPRSAKKGAAPVSEPTDDASLVTSPIDPIGDMPARKGDELWKLAKHGVMPPSQKLAADHLFGNAILETGKATKANIDETIQNGNEINQTLELLVAWCSIQAFVAFVFLLCTLCPGVLDSNLPCPPLHPMNRKINYLDKANLPDYSKEIKQPPPEQPPAVGWFSSPTTKEEPVETTEEPEYTGWFGSSNTKEKPDEITRQTESTEWFGSSKTKEEPVETTEEPEYTGWFGSSKTKEKPDEITRQTESTEWFGGSGTKEEPVKTMEPTSSGWFSSSASDNEPVQINKPQKSSSGLSSTATTKKVQRPKAASVQARRGGPPPSKSKEIPFAPGDVARAAERNPSRSGVFLIYLGFDPPKPGCDFSYPQTIYKMLTLSYPMGCLF